MQQLKFRVWDKEAKAMLGEFSDGIMIQATTGRAGHYDDDNNFVDDYEVMLFIGLKDKNENDIYVGDIIFGWGVNILVEFVNGAAGYYTSVDTDWKEFHAFATHNHLSINNGVCKQLEVIGNVKETPNLMSGRHEA